LFKKLTFKFLTLIEKLCQIKSELKGSEGQKGVQFGTIQHRRNRIFDFQRRTNAPLRSSEENFDSVNAEQRGAAYDSAQTSEREGEREKENRLTLSLSPSWCVPRARVKNEDRRRSWRAELKSTVAKLL